MKNFNIFGVHGKFQGGGGSQKANIQGKLPKKWGLGHFADSGGGGVLGGGDIPMHTMGRKCPPTYACIFVDELEQAFLQAQDHQPLLWIRYIDDIFFIWTHGEKRLQMFLERFNKFHPNVQFTYESSKENILFLDLNIKLPER